LVEEKTPNILDYLTAGIIANTFKILWDLAINFYPVLDYISFIIYIIGGGLVTYLVCNKASRDFTLVSVKASVASWATTMFFYQINILEIQGLTFALILLISYTVGGYIGAYLYQKEKFKTNSTPISPPKNDLDESETLQSDEECKVENDPSKKINPET